MQTVLTTLAAYIADTHLEGDASELDENTPLLEWGVIDSMGMVELLTFIEAELGVRVPDDDVVPEHFATLGRIAALVLSRREAA